MILPTGSKLVYFDMEVPDGFLVEFNRKLNRAIQNNKDIAQKFSQTDFQRDDIVSYVMTLDGNYLTTTVCFSNTSPDAPFKVVTND